MKIDGNKFSKIEKEVFAPLYPLLAEQIIAATGKTTGTCIDLGCGTGALGCALLQKTRLQMLFYDESPQMLELAAEKMAEQQLAGRFSLQCGDVANIDLADGAVDLAVSRGSIFFWEHLEKSLQEIERILAPGGWAYIGGGFGSQQVMDEIIARMEAKPAEGKESFSAKIRRNLGPEMQARFASALSRAGIRNYTVLRNDEIGLWIIIRKCDNGLPAEGLQASR